MTSRVFGVAAVATLLATAACERPAPPAKHAAALSAANIGDGLAWGAVRDFDESDSALMTAPITTADSDGFLVADFSEAQIRRYDMSGRLQWKTGRKGDGPGEWRHPTAVTRLGNGNILAADLSSRVVEYNHDGKKIIRTSKVPLDRIDGLYPLGGDRVLVAGLNYHTRALLHVLNVATDSIELDFFRGEDHLKGPALTAMAGPLSYVVVDRHADTLAIVHPMADSIYFYTVAGAPVGSIRIPTDSFRMIERNPPVERINNDMAFRKQWFSSFDIIWSVNWLRDGTLLVKYGPLGDHLTTLAFLVRCTRDGKRLLQTKTRGLMAVDPRTDSLYFMAPDADVPDRWIAARLKQ